MANYMLYVGSYAMEDPYRAALVFAAATAARDKGYEAQVAERLARWREAQRLALGITRTENVPDLPVESVQEIKHKHKPTGRLEG